MGPDYQAHAHALYLAARDPRVPWYAKAVAVAFEAYAFSPIDIIPDFILVLGSVDDFLIVPLGIALVVNMRDGLRNLQKVLTA